MADEGEGNKEDLFEDLDKFFAPIRDVEWPEPAGPPAERPSPPAGEREERDEPEPPPATEPADTGGPEEPVVIDDIPEVTPGQAGLFVQDVEEMAEDEPAPESFETEELTPEPAMNVGDITSFSPTEYEGLPGPDDDDEDIVEGPATAGEEEPSFETVEAAAEHFAESVRGQEPTGTFLGEADDAGAPGGPEEVERSILDELDEPAPAPRTVKVGLEGLGGPSWQEASTHEVGPDHERRLGGRDMPAAFVTGAGLAVVAIVSLLIGKPFFAFVAGGIALVGQGELYGVLHKNRHQPATAIGLVSGVLILAAGYLKGEPAMVAMVALALVATFLWYMAIAASHRVNVVANIGLTMLGVFYVPLLAGYALVMLSLPDGRSIVGWVLGLTFAFDTVAFVGGQWFGGTLVRRPMAESISPSKSWEGLIAGTLITIALSVGFVPSFVDAFNNHVAWAIELGIVISAFATFGDLAESLLKRDLAIKDMGNILPGHGGVLDRIDSLLFVAPAVFIFLRLLLG